MTTELPPAQNWRAILSDGIEHRIRVEPYDRGGNLVLWEAIRVATNKTVAAGHGTPGDALRYALREFGCIAVEVLAEDDPTRAELIAQRDAARESLTLVRSHRDHLTACCKDADKHAAQLTAVLNERTAERDAWKARADEFDDSLAKETSAHIALLATSGAASDRAQMALARLAKVVAAVEVDAHDRKQLDAAVDALTRELATTRKP